MLFDGDFLVLVNAWWEYCLPGPATSSPSAPRSVVVLRSPRPAG
jgi:hypothetical protein